MARYRQLGCPDCGGTFRWLQHPSDEPLPDFCPRCGSNMTQEPVFVPQAPHLAKTIGKSADQVYRQMEDASRARMYQAAEMTGDDVSEFAGMAITDLPDYLRSGEIGASIPQPPADSPVVKGAGFQGATGQEYAAAVSQGVFPNRGDQTRQIVTSSHLDRVQRMVGQGVRARS